MKKLIFLFIVSIEGNIFAQNNILSLSQCIDYAYKNSIEIKLQEISTDILLLQKKQALFSFLPSFSGSFSHAYQYGRSIDPFTNQFALEKVQTDNLYASGDVLVFQGFYLVNQWKKKKLEYENGQLNIEVSKRDIALAIATAYLQVLFYREEYERALRALENSIAQVNKTKLSYEIGQLAKDYLLQMEAQQAADEAQVQNMLNQLQLAKLTLKQLMNYQDTTYFDIISPNENLLQDTSFLLTQTSETIYQQALQNYPLLKVSENNVTLAKYELRMSRSLFYPSIRLYSNFGTGYSSARKQISNITFEGFDTLGITSESMNEYVLSPAYSYNYEIIPFRKQWEDNFNKTVGITLNIPLFNKFNAHINISLAKLKIQNMQLQLDQQRWELKKNIEKSYYDALAALSNYRALKKQKQAQEEVFKAIQYKFNTGKVSPFEYNDAKNKLQQTEADLNKVKYELIFRIKILEFYMGKEISL